MKLKNYSSFLIFIFLLCLTSLSAQENKQTQYDQVNPFEQLLGKGAAAYGSLSPRLPGFGNFIKVKGDVLVTGNQIINRTTDGTAGTGVDDVKPVLDASGQPTNLAALTVRANTNYNGGRENDRLNFEYIDIDTDNTTFSSSTANLEIRSLTNNTPGGFCKKIVYAGLYWAAFYPYDRIDNTYDSNSAVTATVKYPIVNNNWNQVKFKVPGGTYQTLTADTDADAVGDEDDIVFGGFGPLGSSPFTNNSTYVCYKNVTNLLKSLTDANGTYTIADMLAGRGNDQGGLAGGWSLVVVFESPSYPLKYVSVVDGCKILYNDTGNTSNRRLDYTFSGFKTLPTGSVNARIGVAALEGDRPTNNDFFKNDVFQVKNTSNNFVNLSSDFNRSQPDYPDNNFFQSNLSRPNNFPSKNGINITRSPSCNNTLGFDLDIVNLDNVSKTLITNGQTSIDVRVETSGDDIIPYLNTFSVDIADAKVIFTKVIKKTNGTLVANNGNVALGEQLNYVIGFQNIGSDDATNVTITDVLPANVVFDPATLNLPAGVTYVYNSGTRTLTFTIANSLVEKNDFRTEFNIEFLVEKDCTKFEGSCSNIISNTAKLTYTSNGIVTDVDSGNVENVATCVLEPTPSPTVFNVNTSGCLFTRTEVICGNNLILTAPSGYASYAWTRSLPTPSTLGTNQTQTVNGAGTFSVLCTPIAGCSPVIITYTVFDIDNIVTDPIPHPILPFADPAAELTCTGQGLKTQVIVLCGANNSKLITTGITSFNSISWQIKNTSGCPVISPCPNTNNSCYTDIAGTNNNPNFLADTAGDYRLVIRYDGAAACTQTFYFKVTKAIQPVSATNTDIICGSAPGIITVVGFPSGYEYQVQGPFPATTTSAWQTSPNISVGVNPSATTATGPGTYTAFIRVTGGPANSCVYKVPNISVLKVGLDIQLKVTQPPCSADTGSITVFANGVAPYLYTIRSGNQTGAIVQTSGSTTSTQVTFTGLLPGNYTARIDATGCTTWLAFTITRPALLTATAGVNIPYTFCAAGEVRVTAGGGTSPYLYSIDGGLFQSSSRFPINDTNTHTFTVKDVNECVVTSAPFTMPFADKPTFTVTPTDIVCDPQSGALNFTNLTNPGGFTFAYEYSGDCFRITPTPWISSPSPTIPNLVGGSYLVRVKCTIGTGLNQAVCYTDVQTVVITTQFPSLTATGGVSAFAGCFNGTDGEIRITNPQGGSGNYLYSFDGDIAASYTASIKKVVPPGIYEIYILDTTTGCKFKMNVKLDPKPAPPSIVVANTSFNCNGSSTATVTITNTGTEEYSYQYFIDKNDGNGFQVNTNNAQPNVFLGVTCSATPKKIRIKYTDISTPTFSNLLNEDFGTGANTALPPNSIATAYCYNDQCSRVCNNTTDPNDPYRDRLEDGQYVVTRAIIPNNGAWWPARDHTSTVPSPSNPTGTYNPNGRFLGINIGAAAGANGILYSKRIFNVLNNLPIIVTAYVTNLLKTTVGPAAETGFIFEITTSSGVPISLDPLTPVYPIDLPRSDSWLYREVRFNPGIVPPGDYLIFNVRSSSVFYGGNDAAIDDIKVFQIPKVCVPAEEFDLIVPCDKAFTAKVDSVKNVDCFGTNTGAVTISAENFLNPDIVPPNTSFEWSVNGTAGPYYQSTVSPVVVTAALITSLGGNGAAFGGNGPYNIDVRFNSTSVGCSFPLTGSFTQPTQLSVTAIKTNATCSTNGFGTITATGAGGSAAFEYQLLNSSLAVVPGFAYGSTNINNGTGVFTSVPPGTYFVQVRDFNKCTRDATTSVEITGTTNPQPNLASAPVCFTASNLATLTIGVTGGLGPFVYSILPAAAGVFINNTIKVNAGVTYTISVTDANGCSGSFSPPVVRPELTVNLTQVQTTNCGADILNGTIAGGLAPFTYQVSSNNGATFGAAIAVPVSGTGTTFSYTAAVSGVPISGTFVIRVTDSRTPVPCTAVSTAFTVTPIVTITSTAPVISIATCNNPNGSVTIGADTGTSPYTYSFDGSPFSSTVTYGTLAAATYPYKIKDSKGCEYIGSVTVPSSGLITGTANFSPYICGANGNSIITFTGMPSNSVALGYEYSIGGAFQNSPIFGTAAAGNLNGTYNCIIRDGNNCPFNAGILTIPALNSVVAANIDFTETILASCSTTGALLTATGQVSVTSANPIIKYEITAPASALTNVTGATSGLFSGLVAGTTYTFQVTDSKNCEASNSFTIATPNSISVAGNKTNAKCKGESNGTLNYTVSNFLPGTYSYIVTNVTAGTTIVPLQTLQTSATISSVVLNNLPAGTYKIVVTSTQTGCTDTIDLIISEPAIALTASNTPTAITCSASGIIGAQVQLNGINGGSPYTYTLLSPSNTPISGTNGLYTGLTAVGTYTGSVTDNFGCTITTTFTLANPAAPTVTVNPATLCFNGSTADVVINVTGGLAPYQYNLDNAGFPALAYNNITLNSSNNFTLSLSQGAHTIIIRGANGCFFTIPAFTIRPQLAVSTTFKDSDCSASPAANISGTITGGTAPFGYQTSINGATFLPALPILPALPNTLGGNLLSFTPPTPATLPTVTYVVRVIDSKGCFADSLPITINPIVAVTGDNLPPTDATCGAANGTVTINALTGTAPFTYRFDGVFPFTFTTQNVYSGAAGAHSYQVRDSKGCTSDIYFVTIGSPGGVVGTVSSVDLSCNVGSGTITFATPTAGTGPFTYSINGTSGTFVSTNVFGNPTPLAVGTYVCVIKDAFGCPYVIGSETINPINPPTEISFGQSNTVCTALGNSATVTLSPTALNAITKYEIISPLLAVIDNGTSNVFNGLASGTYTFQITDSKNCKLIRTFEVNPPVQIAVSGQLISNVKCQLTATGAIRFNVSGFTGTYSYSVANTGLNSTIVPSQIGQTASIINFTALRAGTYTITVTSSTGCTSTDFVTVTEAPVALTAAPTFTPLPCPTGTASITVNASGGIGSYTYVLDRPSPQADLTQVSPNGVFIGLTLAGLYTITITDTAGCIITRDVTLDAPVNPTVSVNASTFCVTSGIANVSVTSSLTAPFEYSLDGGTYLTATTNPFIVNVTPSATPHTIRVKDNLQCLSGIRSFTINLALTVTTTLTPAKCDLVGNPVAAIISGTVGNGYPNYGYQVYFSATLPALPLPAATAFLQATPVAMGAGITNYSYTTTNGAGYYVIRFTDANGCKVDSNLINVTPLISITATNNITNVLCNGGSTGAVTIVPSGGVPPYQVNFNDGTGFLGFSSSLSYSGLSAANVLAIDPGTIYNYVIRDSNGCLRTGSAEVKNSYEKIAFDTRVVPLQCIPGNPSPANGEICVESLSGGFVGLTGFQYILNPTNGQPQQTFTALTGQNHCFTGLEFGIFNITVVDANNCTIQNNNIKIAAPPDDLTVDATTFPTVSCLPSSGVVIVKATSPLLLPTDVLHFAIQQDPALIFPSAILPNPWSLGTFTPAVGATPAFFSYTFTGLTAGVTYDFVVYSVSNDCYYAATADAPVGQFSTIQGVTTPNTVTCLGSNDASVDLEVKNFTGTQLTYQVFTSPFGVPVGAAVPLTGLIANVPNTVPNIGVLSPGAYYILMTEVNGTFAGCQTSSAIFNIVDASVALVLPDPTVTNDNDCQLNAGTITAAANGGSGSFKYRITPDSGIATQGIYSTNSTFNVEGAPFPLGITYNVEVKDANGCVKNKNVTVFSTPNPQVTVGAVLDQCTSTGASYTFNATATLLSGVAPYTFTINNIVQGTSATAGVAVPITVNNSGTYVVTITDKNGCKGTASVTIYPIIAVSAVETVATVCPLNNAGQAQATATGGSGSFNYTISPSGTINLTTGLATGLTAVLPFTTYTIRATDVLPPFCFKETTINLTPAQVVDFTLGQSPVSCNNASNGNNANGTITVTLDPTMNEGPYTYQITSPFVGAIQNSPTFTGLSAVAHNVRVTSAKACFDVKPITVGAPLLPVTAALQLGTPAAFSCTNTTTSLTIIPGGGVGGYTYSIDGTNYLTTNVFDDIPDTGTILLPQIINYFVKDANGCIATNSVTLTPLSKVTATVALSGTALTCTTGEQVTVTATNGSGNYEYELQGSGFPASATNTFSLTNAGTTAITYTFKVTDLTSGCSTLATYVVNPLPVLTVNASRTNVVCNGALTGTVTFSVTNFIGTYTYGIYKDGSTTPFAPIASSSSTSNTISNLPAGNYVVTVFNLPRCEKTSNNVLITQPDPLQLNLVTRIAQNCNSLGLVTVSALGGTPGYTYAFVIAGAPAPTLAAQFQVDNFEALNYATSATWDVYVRDFNGCIKATPLTVTLLLPIVNPTITLPLITNQCDLLATNFIIAPTTVTVDALATPLTYAITSSNSVVGANFFPAIPNIPIPTIPTTVWLFVKDANGCTDSASVIVYPKLGIDTDIIRQPTCVPLNDGQIKFTASGGSGNYVLTPPTINPSAGAIYNAATNTFSGLIFDVDYTITFTDSDTGCTKTSEIVRLTKPLDPTFNAVPTPVTCNVNGTPSIDGTITVNLTGTNLDFPYSYQLTAGPAGYTVVPAIVLNASTHLFTGLPTGTYTVRVTSNLGCVLPDATVFVGAPLAFTATAAATTFKCDTSNNAPQTATITITPQLAGLPVLPAGYTFSLNGAAGTFDPTNTFNIVDTGLPQTFANLSVKDANGCITVAPSITINPLPKILSATVALSSVPGSRLACDKGEDVLITVLPANALDYSYRLLPAGIAQTSNAFTLPSVGNYTFEITNTQTLCTIQASYEVLPLPILNVTILPTTAILCNGGTGQLTFTVGGYSGLYNYEVYLAPNSVTPIRTVIGVNTSAGNIDVLNLSAGNYTIKVIETDAPRCDKISSSQSLVQPASPVTLDLVSNVPANCNVGAIVTVSASGGNTAGGYTYAFVQDGASPAGLYSSSAQATLDPAINLNWDVYALDANNCPSNKIDVTISRTADPDITAFGPFANNKCDANATFYSFASSIVASGFTTSTSPLTYSLTGAAPFYTLANLPQVPVPTTGPVVYQLTVKDANGCTTTSVPPQSLKVYPHIGSTSEITTFASCDLVAGIPTGVITVAPSGGSGNFTLSFVGTVPATATIAGNVLSGLSPQTYTIRITDNVTSCTKDVEVIMPVPTPVTLSPFAKTDVTCDGGTNGTITVNLATLPLGANNDPIYQYAIISSTTSPLTPFRINQTDNKFLNLPEGTYVVEVTSRKGCKLQQTIVIDDPDPIVIAAPIVTQFGCTTNNIGNQASILVNSVVGNVTGGSGVYTAYEFINTATGLPVRTADANNLLNIANLEGGIYIVKVYDNKGCFGTSLPITIAPFIKIDLPTIAVVDAIRCNNLTEDILVSQTVNFPTIGGPYPAPNLEYTITGTDTTVYGPFVNNNGAFNNLPIGKYKIIIKNIATGCVLQVNHFVNDPSVYRVIIENIVAVKCFGDSTGSATIRMVNASLAQPIPNQNLPVVAAPFSYIIRNNAGGGIVTSGNSASNPTGMTPITGLPFGNYTAELTLTANPNMCKDSFAFSISQPLAPLTVVATQGSQVGCSPKQGSINVLVSGGTPFTNGINAPYTVTLINTTPIPLGAGPGPFVGNATNLEEGIYQVLVTDANGCVPLLPTFVTLAAPVDIFANFSVAQSVVNCPGDTTTINLTGVVSGGQGSNYTFNYFEVLAGGGSVKLEGPTSATFFDAGAGTFTVLIEDGLGCGKSFGPFTINNPSLVVPTLVTSRGESCSLPQQLTLGASGGTGPYTYSSDNGLNFSAATFTTATPVVIDVAPGVRYKYIVKDALGCEAEIGTTTQIVPLISLLSQSQTNITCFGESDGSIQVKAQGGFNVDYSYSISTISGVGPTNIGVNTTGLFENLTYGAHLGVYYITVVSTDSCPKEFPFTLIQPKQFIVKVIPIDVKCNGENNGQIVLEIENAVGALQYAISTTSNSTTANQFFDIPGIFVQLSAPGVIPVRTGVRFTIAPLAPDSYLLTVKDQGSCPYTTTAPIVIEQPFELLSNLTANSEIQELCKGDKNASFSITIKDGTAPYFVSIDNNGTGTYVPANITVAPFGHTFTGLEGGNHTVYVRDSNGCEVVPYVVQLNLPVFLNPVVDATYPCPEDAPGIKNYVIISVDPSNNLADVTFSIDGGSFLPSNNAGGFRADNLTVGTHTFEVQHTNGCRQPIAPNNTFDIRFVDPLALKLTDGNLNQIIAIASGGVAPYNYSFNGVSTGQDNTYIYDKTGNYSVTIVDTSNCKLTVTKAFNFIDIFIPNFFSPNGDGENDNWSPQNTYNYKNLVFFVFDRYGRKIVSLKEGQQWDGKYEGEELPTGDYWYIVKTEESSTREFVGNFTLYR